MKILFTLAHGYLPQGHGGLQKSIDQLSQKLTKKGHKTSVLASLMHGGVFSLVSRINLQLNRHFSGRRLTRDTVCGYPVWRTWFPWGKPDGYFPRKEIEYVIGREKPDVVVVGSGFAVPIALIAKETGVPVLMNLVDVEFQDHGGSFRELGQVVCVANSLFTANKHHQAFGVSSVVINPLISKEDYRTETTRENITFINPSPNKGINIAMEIVQRCPDIPFVFNIPWRWEKKYYRDFVKNLESIPNITVMPPEDDMRKVYGRSKIVLAPSLWQEGYGRIATEAQISGIPVVASTRGGLPEAVGPGGVAIDPEAPIDVWVESIHKLWQDDTHYAAVSAAARAHAYRPALDNSQQTEAWEEAILQAIGMAKGRTTI